MFYKVLSLAGLKEMREHKDDAIIQAARARPNLPSPKYAKSSLRF